MVTLVTSRRRTHTESGRIKYDPGRIGLDTSDLISSDVHVGKTISFVYLFENTHTLKVMYDELEGTFTAGVAPGQCLLGTYGGNSYHGSDVHKANGLIDKVRRLPRPSFKARIGAQKDALYPGLTMRELLGDSHRIND
jgi:hypothetical protein